MQVNNLQDTTLFSNSFFQTDDSLVIKAIPYNSKLSLKGIDSIINATTNDTLISCFPYPAQPIIKENNKIAPSYTQSIFSHHLLQPKDMQTHGINAFGSDWIFGIFLLCFILLSWIRIFYKKRLNLILKTFISQRTVNLLLRDGTLFNERISLALSFICFSTISMLAYYIYLFIAGSGIKSNYGLILYGQIFIIILALTIFKILLINIIGNVFNNKGKSFEYQLNDLIFFQVLGIILLPIILIYSYLQIKSLLYLAIIIVGFWFVYKLIRGLYISMTHSKFSLFYFCTFAPSKFCRC